MEKRIVYRLAESEIDMFLKFLAEEGFYKRSSGNFIIIGRKGIMRNYEDERPIRLLPIMGEYNSPSSTEYLDVRIKAGTELEEACERYYKKHVISS